MFIVSKNIIIKKASNSGKGLFTLKDFKKDEFILHIDVKVIETTNPNSFSKEIQDHWFPFDKKGDTRKYVFPKSPWKYFNHSCNPNAGINNNRDIVAMMSIKKGEEIVFDYTMNNIDNWKMNCKCGSKNCRKIISTFDVLNEKIKEKYLNYVLDCIKKKYLRCSKKN